MHLLVCHKAEQRKAIVECLAFT